MSFIFQNIPLEKCTIGDVFPYSLNSVHVPTVSKNDTLDYVLPILVHNLDSFSDGVVITKDGKIFSKPLGMIGGKDILENLMKNHTSDFFSKTAAFDIMYRDVIIASEKTMFFDLLDEMTKARRAFAVLKSLHFDDHFSISARSFLEIGAELDSKITPSDIPSKEIITFSGDETVRDVITSMIDNKVRRLLLDDTNSLISDRHILEHLVHNPEFIKDIDKFLEMKSSFLQTGLIERFPEHIPIKTLCKVMYTMPFPCALCGGIMVTPWDIIQLMRYRN